MIYASVCTQEHVCALRSITHNLNSNKNESIEAINAAVWEEIVESAETSGDALDYDGPLTWGTMA